VTGLLLIGPVAAMPAMPGEPSKDDAREALARLRQLLDEFPFVDDVSRSVALSALITPVVRGACNCVPGHFFDSPTPGTGKSYLQDVATAIACQR
jgi:putative DNA primase/helicase